MALRDTSGQSIFPSWIGLLQRAADELTKIGKTKPSGAIRSMIDYEMYQEAADIAKKALVGTAWGDFLARSFDIPPENFDPESLALPRAIWEISRRIITLNFDKVLRYTCPSHSVIAFDNENKIALADFVRASDEKDFIWHLHGSIDNITNLVFTSAGYEELYETDKNLKAAISSLGTVSATERLLFIGCSLSDAELIAKISEVAKIFDSHIGPHYALVHKNEAIAVEEKLKGLPFEIVAFEEFGEPLTSLIKSLARIEKRNESNPRQQKTQKSKNRVAVLTCDAIDHRYGNIDLLKEIKKLRFEMHFFSLNTYNLNSLNDFAYVFILSNSQRGKVLIEDEWLAAQRVGVDEMIDNIDDTNIKGIFIFLDSLDIDPKALERVATTKTPVLLSPKLSKSQCISIGFKLFKKFELTLSEHSKVINRLNFSLQPMDGECSEIKYKTLLPDAIDPRSLRSFVGRIEDLKNICKRILENRDSGDVLTVKGAGGIGKTMLVKKAAVELANRAIFSDGIYFIDCEFIKDVSNFQQQVGHVFDLQQADDFRSKMKEHGKREDRLVVLDNAETLLSHDNETYFTELIDFISAYCTLVVTSREPLRLENEVIVELRQLTTDEAVELFINELSLTDLDQPDLLFVRERIVEDLLDNNPLAIKLVTKSTPKGKDLRVLHGELENDVLSRVRDDETSIFDRVADRNVERKSSVFASINYSYNRLNEREKTAFEILSLFPDGINMENFKRVSATAKASKRRNATEDNNPAKQFLITDSLIKSLENKSIIEIDNETVSLQSLVGRFAESVFAQRTPSEIRRFRKNAFSYNEALADALARIIREKPLLASSVFWKFQKNLLKALALSNSVGVEDFSIVDYISDISALSTKTCAYSGLLNAMERANFNFEDKNINDFLSMVRLQLRYFMGDFDEAFSELKQKFSFEYLISLDDNNFVSKYLSAIALNIYFMEGFHLDVVKLMPKYGKLFGGYADVRFQLGDFDTELILKSASDFTTLDAKFTIGQLNLEELDSYIRLLHKQQHLERIQANYLRVKLCGKSLDQVDSLVTVNSYAVGIKHLITAMVMGDTADAELEFETAIEKLCHIKYYYVDAIVNYAKYLSRVKNNNKLRIVADKGLCLARLHGFRFLQYQLEKICGLTCKEFLSEDYPMPKDISDHIENLKNQERLR